MPHTQCTTLPSWPNAYPASGATATLKRLNEDFIVTELPLQLPSGEGEHIWLDNLQAIASHGVPNYFGAQRFGFEGGNVEQGRAMLAREIRVRNPKKKGIYLSAVRSFVFNEVLALRIQQGLWGKTLPGDVMDEAGRPTGPLWGRGRVTTSDQAQALENGVAERHATLCEGMEHAGLDQERRALVAFPADLSWEWPQADQLVLTFSLPAGNYATSVLNEILRTTEPDRHTENEPSAVEGGAPTSG